MRGFLPTPVFLAGLLLAMALIVFGPFKHKIGFIFLVAMFTLLIVGIYEESQIAKSTIVRIRDTWATENHKRARAAEILHCESGIEEDVAAEMVARLDVNQIAGCTPREIASMAVRDNDARDEI